MRNKHRKGRSRKPLEEIDDKAKQKNVVRCRNYRSEKKVGNRNQIISQDQAQILIKYHLRNLDQASTSKS